MYDKVLRTLEHIVQHPEGIRDTFVDGHEIYFAYKGQRMSVVDRRENVDPHGRYSVYFYPGAVQDSAMLADLFQSTTDDVPMIPYHSRDTDNDRPFRDLYATVLGAHYHLDSVLDQILS